MDVIIIPSIWTVLVFLDFRIGSVVEVIVPTKRNFGALVKVFETNLIIRVSIMEKFLNFIPFEFVLLFVSLVVMIRLLTFS